MWLCHARALAVLALFVCPQTRAADALSGTPITPALRKIALLALNQDRDPPVSAAKHANVLPRLDTIQGVECAATGESRCYQVTHASKAEWFALLPVRKQFDRDWQMQWDVSRLLVALGFARLIYRRKAGGWIWPQVLRLA